MGHPAALAGCLGVLAPGCAVGLLCVGAIAAGYALIKGFIRRIPVAGRPAGRCSGCLRGTDIVVALLSRLLRPGRGIFLCGRAICVLRPVEGMRCVKPPVN